MEMRKVQITGGSTFIVSLPKQWAREVGLSANDTVGIMPQADGTLILTPHLSTDDEPRRKVFNLPEEPAQKELLRDLIGAYVIGYDLIEVHQEPRMTTGVRNIVRTFTRLVIGPEIIHEDIDDIKTRDLLSPSDLPFRTSIQRMYRLVSSMHREAALACCELDLDMANDVEMRDTEVDRLGWLVARQYNLSVSDILLAEKLGTTREHAVNFMLISRVLERMGDHSVRMAMQVEDLRTARAKKAHRTRILRTADTILPVLDDVISALFQRDSKLAHNAMEQADGVLVAIYGFKEDIADSPGGAGLPMGMVVDSLDRTVHYIKDIGELVINYSIDKA